MSRKILKRLLVTLGVVLAATVVMLVALGLVLEAQFRPHEEVSIAVSADRGHLHGKVTESSGWIPFVLPGIAAAKISLSPGALKITTDDDGLFAIPDVVPGIYTVTVTAEGFETTKIEDLPIAWGTATTLPDLALFPQSDGPPVARLKVSGPVPFASAPESVPYLTPAYLDASASENISRYGTRFEIRDTGGTLLTDPVNDDEPLQPEPSGVPGTSPALFLFTPPRPGTYDVKIILTNAATPGTEDTASVEVRAVNSAPEALAVIIAGPNPPRKTPTYAPLASSGLSVVRTGEDVYVLGLGLDRNHASPELYNTGGIEPDTYGKNHDHLQEQFSFRWELFHVDERDESRTPLHHLLLAPNQSAATEGQVIHFRADRPGRYEIFLEVEDNDPFGSLSTKNAVATVTAVDDGESQNGSACATCHDDRVARYQRTAHGAANVGCENCHGPAAAHLAVTIGDEDYADKKRATQDVSYESGLCGRCHDEYAEWEKSRHSDGTPYGYHEIAPPIMVECAKCHYARTFAATLETVKEAGVSFGEFHYKTRAAGIGPLMPDMSKLPTKGETGVSCSACHAPHDAVDGESVGLRTGDEPGALCQTCHEQKWQNTVLEGTAGEVRNGYEYPGEDYDLKNPHNTRMKCVMCHLGDQTEAVDSRGVRAVGGHTLRMRDTGPDQLLGGVAAAPGKTNDVLHVAPCLSCHDDVETFKVKGLQGRIHESWTALGDLLSATNSGILPGTPPGDKCATCHRGGTMPFDDDPGLILENAYTNYKLVKNDRSWGIHNPAYVKKLLADSIVSVEAYLQAHGRKITADVDDVKPDRTRSEP